MITALSLILAIMLSIGGSPAGSFNPAGGHGDTGIQGQVENSLNTNRFFEDYTQKTASRPDSKKIIEIPSINNPKTQIRLIFTLPLKEKPLLMGYEDSMNLYQAFGMNPINFVDPFGNQYQVTVTPKGAEFERPMTVGEFWESLREAGVSEDEALNIIAESTYYSKYFWDGSLVDRIKTHQMDLTLTDSESRALGMEYNVTLKGPREQFGRLFRGEFKEFGKAALENLDRQFGDPENLALMFSGGVKYKPSTKIFPRLGKPTGRDWAFYFREKYGSENVQWSSLSKLRKQWLKNKQLIIKAWEEAHGKEWPKTSEGKPYIPHHNPALSEGGSIWDITPIHPKTHAQMHGGGFTLKPDSPFDPFFKSKE